MDIHEYQAKKILSGFGVTIPRGELLIVLKMPRIKLESWEDLSGW